MRRVGALDHRGELRVADARLHPGRADRAGADADLHDVRPRQEEFLDHLAGDHVARDDGLLRKSVARPLHEFDEALRIAVRDVDADELQLRVVGDDGGELVEIGIRGAGAYHDAVVDVVAMVVVFQPGVPLRDGVVLVQRGQHPVFRQPVRHFEGACGVHVGGDDRHAGPVVFAMQESEVPLQIDL